MAEENIPIHIKVPEWDEVKEMLKAHPRAWAELYTLESIQDLYSTKKLFGYIIRYHSSKILALFEIVCYPKAKVLRLSFLMGNGLHRLRSLVSFLDTLASSLGCPIIEVTGRPGFSRYLTGYSEVTRTWVRRVKGNFDGSSQQDTDSNDTGAGS